MRGYEELQGIPIVFDLHNHILLGLLWSYWNMALDRDHE